MGLFEGIRSGLLIVVRLASTGYPANPKSRPIALAFEKNSLPGVADRPTSTTSWYILKNKPATNSCAQLKFGGKCIIPLKLSLFSFAIIITITHVAALHKLLLCRIVTIWIKLRFASIMDF
eukprot:EG_transcript_38931